MEGRYYDQKIRNCRHPHRCRARCQKICQKKIAKLDGYMPKHARKSAHAEVKLKETKVKARKEATCEVILFLPGEKIQASETTINMYAAIDIVEEKLKTQLKKYKDAHKRSPQKETGRIRRVWQKIAKSSAQTD